MQKVFPWLYESRDRQGWPCFCSSTNKSRSSVYGRKTGTQAVFKARPAKDSRPKVREKNACVQPTLWFAKNLYFRSQKSYKSSWIQSILILWNHSTNTQRSAEIFVWSNEPARGGVPPHHVKRQQAGSCVELFDCCIKTAFRTAFGIHKYVCRFHYLKSLLIQDKAILRQSTHCRSLIVSFFTHRKSERFFSWFWPFPVENPPAFFLIMKRF